MRQVPIPHSNSANEFGVELDKTLSDGSKALGIVRIVDGPSPYNPDDILLRVTAWQVTPQGQPITVTATPGANPSRRGIREQIVLVPRGEYTADVAQKQIAIAAAALQLEVADIPEPVTLPASGPDNVVVPVPAQ